MQEHIVVGKIAEKLSGVAIERSDRAIDAEKIIEIEMRDDVDGFEMTDAAADSPATDIERPGDLGPAKDVRPDLPGADAWACREYYASKFAHVDAGRAYPCGVLSHICAKGSDEDLGLMIAEWIWLEETAQDYYKRGRCGG